MIKNLKSMNKEFTKYEIARILGARALQVAMDAPLLIKFEKEELEKLRYDPIKIAEVEFRDGVLPISIKRPFPKKFESARDLEKKRMEVKDEEREDKEIDSIERAEEKEIEEEGSEIMELATPEDEKEDIGEEKEGVEI